MEFKSFPIGGGRSLDVDPFAVDESVGAEEVPAGRCSDHSLFSILVSGSDLASMGSFFVGFTYGIGKVDATHDGYCQTSLRDCVIRDWCGIAEAHHQ